MITIYILMFLIGIIFGSFFNVVGIRSLKGEKISYPPSHCVKCGYELKVKDLFPIISWLSLKGKCRNCKEPISPIYPIGEFFTGITFVLLFYKFGISIEFLINIIFMSFMIMATVSDLIEMIVPDRFFIIGTVIIFAIRVITKQEPVIHLISGLAMSAGLFLLMFLSSYKVEDEDEKKEIIKEIQKENIERKKRNLKPIKYDKDNLRGYKMGGADAKIYLLIGLAIGGIQSVESLLIASIVAGIIMGIVSIKQKNITNKTPIPFFPFITIGVLLSYFIPLYETLQSLI